MSEKSLVQKLINGVQAINLGNGTNENIEPSLNTNLFLIAQLTRNIQFLYATLTSAGNIHFHTLIPMKSNDPNERNQRFKNKTVWLSVSNDPNKSTRVMSNPDGSETETITYHNSNAAIIKMFMKKTIEYNGKDMPNLYNCLHITGAKIRWFLAPASIDQMSNEILRQINTPALNLQSRVKTNIENCGDDSELLKQQNNIVYEEYKQELMALYDQGLLMLTQILITPKQNSIMFSIEIDETTNSVTNPWLNYNALMSLGLPITNWPHTSEFRGLVQIIQDSTEEVMHSDNDKMFGKRTMTQDSETGQVRWAYSTVGLIKDFGNQTEILVSLTDNNRNLPTTEQNGNNKPRGRVESFESMLERGTNLFYITGTIRPVVRHVNDNAGRNGNIFFELQIDQYSVHRTTSVTNSIEFDIYSELPGFDAVQEIEMQTPDETHNEKKSSSKKKQNEENNIDMI